MGIRAFIIVILLSTYISSWAGPSVSGKSSEIVSIINIDESNWQSFVYDAQIFEQRLDTHSKIRFWSLIINTSEKYVVINLARNRQILQLLPSEQWDGLAEAEKESYREFLRSEFCLPADEKIYITRGKSEYYRFREAMPGIDRGINHFMDLNVDPWYAQAILLIESPGQLARSPEGALGPFQLMPKIARKYGLRVDAQVDERKDFDRSAFAAASLMQNICLPYTREMLSQRGLEFDEGELWFRLLAMHVYHAGAYNVKNALLTIPAECRGMDLIHKLWDTEAKGFKNASQNYGQIVLASMISLDRLINENCVIYHQSEVDITVNRIYPRGSAFTGIVSE